VQVPKIAPVITESKKERRASSPAQGFNLVENLPEEDELHNLLVNKDDDDDTDLVNIDEMEKRLNN